MILAQKLDSLSAPGSLYEKAAQNALRCTACAHRCLIREGRRGICQVRFNSDGKLNVPWGYVAALQVDPIEKKPLYHFFSGEKALSFGMLGCDLHCAYCQNWLTSQALRDPVAEEAGRFVREINAVELVALARHNGAGIIASTYNEPLITAEWAVEIFRTAKAAGLKTVMVSNGNATPESLAYLAPHLDGYKIDLKSMQEKKYRQLGGRLQPVLDTIQSAYEMGLWVEVVTLVVPNFNDSTAELWDTARYLASVSPDIPWHVTAFHGAYKMQDTESTPPVTLLRAADIGREAGLRYVYAGNLHGFAAGEYESTRCPHCNKMLIKRHGFSIQSYRLDKDGSCPYCGEKIAGVWASSSSEINLHDSGMPRVL